VYCGVSIRQRLRGAVGVPDEVVSVGSARGRRWFRHLPPVTHIRTGASVAMLVRANIRRFPAPFVVS
jgi:hypothetical protein